MPEPKFKQRDDLASVQLELANALRPLLEYKSLSARELGRQLTILSEVVKRMSTSGNLDENSASFIGKTLRPIISDSNVSENTRAYARSILIPLSRPTPAGAREGAAAAGGVVSELDPYRYSLLTGTDAAAQFGRDLEKILHYEPIIQGAIKPTTDKGTSFTLAPIVPAELGGYFGYNLISDKGDIETAQKLSNAVLRVQAGLAGPRETVWLANQFAGSDQLKKELGADTFSKFVSELKKGNVDEAMKLLPEGNAMKQYLGKVKEQGVSIEERSDRESITLYRWGAGIILKFDEQEYKLWRKLNTRTESNPLYVVILAVGVGYSDSMLKYNMVKTERRPGKEPVVTTTKKSKELTDAWYEKGTLDVAGAVGVGAVASVLKVHVDAYEQSISITPLAQYTAGGAGLIGVPYLLDFREIKFKRGTTGEKDFWDIELRGGKELGPVGKVPLARLLSVDLEAGWGMLQNGIDGKVTLLARPGERVCISISGKLGRDDIRKSFYGGAAGVRFPIYGPFEGELSGFVTQFPSPKSKNPYLEAGGWANLVVRF